MAGLTESCYPIKYESYNWELKLGPLDPQVTGELPERDLSILKIADSDSISYLLRLYSKRTDGSIQLAKAPFY